jgi:hypothetical protein
MSDVVEIMLADLECLYRYKIMDVVNQILKEGITDFGYQRKGSLLIHLLKLS